MLSKSPTHGNSQKAVRSMGSIFKKRIRFNEDNIRATNNAFLQDYGVLRASNTTFPRLSSYLIVRLHDHLHNKDSNAPHDSDDDASLKSFSITESQTSVGAIDNYGENGYNKEFYRKRKLFNQGEFIVTKQKLMSKEIPAPGPPIGNWRVLDDNVGRIKRSSLKFFMGQGELPRKYSRINDATLLKIREQILFNTQPD